TLFNVQMQGGDLVATTTPGQTKAFSTVGTTKLDPNDDGSSAFIDLSSVFSDGINFYGQKFTGLYVNNNGNVTFNHGLSTFTPGAIPVNTLPIIAPFWGDVDTRLRTGQSPGANGSVVYNLDPVHGSFTASWQTVGC